MNGGMVGCTEDQRDLGTDWIAPWRTSMDRMWRMASFCTVMTLVPASPGLLLLDSEDWKQRQTVRMWGVRQRAAIAGTR